MVRERGGRRMTGHCANSRIELQPSSALHLPPSHTHTSSPRPPLSPSAAPPSPLTPLHPPRYKLLLAGIIDDPKERKLMTIDDDYEEPLLTVIEGNGAGSSTGEIRPEWRGARGEWGRVIVPHG